MFQTADTTNRGSIVSFSVLLVAALVAGRFAVHRSAQTSRPKVDPLPSTLPTGCVHSRLWQDPLEAVYKTLCPAFAERTTSRSTDKTPSPTAGTESVKKLAAEIAGKLDRRELLCILSVFLDGSPYPEDRENRLRSRYAVQSAINRAGLVPQDQERIRYFVHGRAEGPLVVPYEWFHHGKLPRDPGEPARDPGSYQHVLVLWIDQDRLDRSGRDDLLGSLADIVDKLLEEARKRSTTRSPDTKEELTCEVCVIGPTDSGCLAAMRTKPIPAERLPKCKVFSPWATLPDTILEKLGSQDDGSRRQNTHSSSSPTTTSSPGTQQQQGASWDDPKHFERTLADDKKTCHALVKELRLRGVDPQNLRHHIALLVESDTTYGRALPEVFGDAIGDITTAVKSDFVTLAWDSVCGLFEEPTQRSNIHYVRYLRGIDGELPGEDLLTTPAASKAAEDSKQALYQGPSGDTRPEGRAQIDYIVRFQEGFGRYAVRRFKETQGELKAIGVLGSDVYDKLCILRILKPAFPRALFFTTDLDARFLHGEDKAVTQNLIVASPLGLWLGREVHGGIPSFRDSFQASVFLATAKALKVAAANGLKNLQPSIFEIGLTRANELGVNNPKEGKTFDLPQARKLLGVDTRQCICGAIAIILLLAVIVMAFVPRKDLIWGSLKRNWPLWVGTCLVLGTLVVLVVLTWRDDLSAEGEPFLLLEGISIWPTTYLQLLAMLLSVSFCFSVWLGMKRSRDSIDAEFFPPSPSEETSGARPRKPRGSIWVWKADPDGEIKGEWDEYKARRAVRYRALRIMPPMLVFLVAWFLLGVVCWEGVWSLGRGGLSRNMDVLISYLSYLAFLTLLFVTLDVTRLCDKLIQHLFGEVPPKWPADLQAAHAQRWSLKNDDFSEWLSIKLIAQHTRFVDRTIYFPALVLLILLVSRDRMFDGWYWPRPTIALIFFSVLTVVYSAVMLRYSAKSARSVAVKRLRKKIEEATGSERDTRERELERLIERIESEQSGAFCRLKDNPVIRAILIPTAGLGSLAIMDRVMAALV